MRPTPGLYFSIFFLAVHAMAGSAGDSLESVRMLPASSVLASPESLASSDYVVLDSREWEGRAISLPDLLAAQAGVQTRRTGGMGSFQSLSIRGMGGNQIVVCIDGVPLGDGGGGAVDLGQIDLSQFARVEIYKGHVPARFGGNGMGGVVNLVSRTSLQRSGRLLASYGSHNTHEVSVQVAAPWTDSLSWTSTLSQRGSDNDYEFLNRNGTLYNTSDDRTEKRRNAQFSQMAGTHALHLVHAGGSTSALNLQHSQDEGGYPGRESNQTVVAGTEREQFRLLYKWESAPAVSDWQQSAEAFTHAEQNVFRWYYPLDKIGLATDRYMESGALAKGAGARAALFYRREAESPVLSAELHSEARTELLESRDRAGDSRSSDPWQLAHSQGQLATTLGWIPISVLRIEGEGMYRLSRDHRNAGALASSYFDTLAQSNSYRHLGSGRLAVRMGPARGAWSVFAAVGRFFRAPEPMEIYGMRSGVLPNPDLVPETGIQGESGWSYHRKSTQASLTFFANQSHNRIVWLSSGALTKPFNLGETRVLGIETQWSASPWRRLTLTGNATWQAPLDVSGDPGYDGHLLPDEPEQAYAASATLRLPFTFELQWNGEARSHLYRDRANRERIPAQAFHHISLACSPIAQGKLRLSLRNLGEAEYQDIYAAWPTPGRQYNVSYSQDF